MSSLKQANEALRSSQYETAIRLYLQTLQDTPALAHIIQPNLKIAQSRYLKARVETKQPRVLVCGWNLAQNAAGRAATLAQLYQPLADVGIIGCYLKERGLDTWVPLRDFHIPIQGIQVEDEAQFARQALELVLQNPCDLLHLSKPRIPNIIIGALYKRIWNAHVVMDIDDEELAFVSASAPLLLEDYLKTNFSLPELYDLSGETWTRLAVGLADTFDGITVVNPALQQRYGGSLVRHARDAKLFTPSEARRQQNRSKLSIPLADKVVIFLGTPRAHKGLLDTAKAIANLGRKDVRFLVVGDFPATQQSLKAEIQTLLGSQAQFLGDQPFANIPDILAVADISVLLQDTKQQVAQYQTPAKLTDALAMGVTVIATQTPSLSDLVSKDAFIPTEPQQLAATLALTLETNAKTIQPHPVFHELLSLEANQAQLQELIEAAQQRTRATELPQQLQKLLAHLLPQLMQSQQNTPRLPATPRKSSIDFAAMRVEDIISGAADAMQQDDWYRAYEHWNSLLKPPEAERPIQLLLRISRELFKLDAFPEAADALRRAARLDPQNGGVIREQANQYYYHCYSSWLMQVTENEPDWYKADGLDKRPDWKTACQLIEQAEKVAPRSNLRRYVQAYLLLAEEAWDKQNRSEAHAALGVALKAIGPDKLDQSFTRAILAAVDQFRDGQADKKDLYYQSLQDRIKALPLELLNVPDWLCLNDILNWNGLLLCGYVAREKAVDLALAQGKASGAGKETLKTALKAALDRNDTALADDFIGKLKHISPDAIDVQELDSCCELMKGKLGAFRQKWPHPPTPTEQRLRDYLKGKTVAVVGPAPTGTLDGEEIDRHDVVVRMNWRGQQSMPDANEFGSKTNISLYNAHTVRLLKTDKRLDMTRVLDFGLIRRPRHDADRLQMIAEYPGAFYKSLNAVPAVLFNLLLYGVEQIKLFKVTFYLGKQQHAQSYRGRADSGFDVLPLRQLQPVMGNHDLLTQLVFVDRALRQMNLTVDKVGVESLKHSARSYFSSIYKSITISPEERILEQRNKDINNLINLAKDATSRRDWTIAIECWGGVFDNFTDPPTEVYIKYVQSLRALSRFDQADAVIQKGILGQPSDIRLYESWAQNASDRKSWLDAIFRWNIILEKTGKIKNKALAENIKLKAVKNIGISYGNMENYSKSAYYIDFYLNSQPDFKAIKTSVQIKKIKNYSQPKILCLFDDDSTLFVIADFIRQAKQEGYDPCCWHVIHKDGSKISARQLSSILPGDLIKTVLYESVTSRIHENNLVLDFDLLFTAKLLPYSREFYLKKNRPLVATTYPGIDFFPVSGIVNRVYADVICFNCRAEQDIFHEIMPAWVKNNTKLLVYNPKFHKLEKKEIKEVKNVYFMAQAIVPLKRNSRLYVLDIINQTAKKHPDKRFVIKLRHLIDENKAHSHPEEHPYELLAQELDLAINIEFSAESMSDTVDKMDFCITCSSTAGVESVLHGIPTLFWLNYPDAESEPLTEKALKLLKGSNLLSSEEDIISLVERKPGYVWLQDFIPQLNTLSVLLNPIENN